MNYRVEDEDGNLLGVVGSGNIFNELEADFEADFANYEKEHDVQIYITNIGNAHNSFTGSTDYYKDVDTLSAQLQLTPDEIRNPDGGSFF